MFPARFLLCLLLLSGSASSQPVLDIDGRSDAHTLAGTARYLEDRSRLLTVAEVQAAQRSGALVANPSQGNELNFGYSHSAFWIAVPVKLAQDAPRDWLLEVGFPALDRVEVHVPTETGFATLRAGDREAFSARAFAHRNLVFPVRLIPGTETTLFIKVVSEGTLTVPLTLWQPLALHRHDQATYALLAVYYGILLALLLYNLLLFVAVREPVYLAYVACVACMAVGQASLNGLGNQFLWPNATLWGHLALPVAMAATGLFGALFTRLFLRTHEQFPRFDRLLLALAGAFGVSIFSVAFIDYQVGAVLTSLTGMVFAICAVAGGVYCHLRRHPGARYFLLAWSLLLCGVAIMAMRNLGWLPTNLFTTYAMQMGSSLDLLLLSFALADRINTLRREKELATAEVLEARQSVVDTLRRSEQELEGKVAERTLDLRQANARLLEKEKQLAHLARHDPLTGLANRNLLASRLEHSLSRAVRSGRSVALLLVDVDGLKLINDTHGHLVGDQVLVTLAARLTEAVRMTDTVARWGGDEFVVILEEVTAPEDTTQVAEKLVGDAGKPIILPSGARLVATVSIGIARFPQDGATADDLLRSADNAMYAAKAAGRNRWLAAVAA